MRAWYGASLGFDERSIGVCSKDASLANRAIFEPVIGDVEVDESRNGRAPEGDAWLVEGIMATST